MYCKFLSLASGQIKQSNSPINIHYQICHGNVFRQVSVDCRVCRPFIVFYINYVIYYRPTLHKTLQSIQEIDRAVKGRL